LDNKGQQIESAKGSGHVVEIPLDPSIDIKYALLIRNLPHATEQISSSALAYAAVIMALLIT
jgi:putative protease